jgi:hypothetical protein
VVVFGAWWEWKYDATPNAAEAAPNVILNLELHSSFNIATRADTPET